MGCVVLLKYHVSLRWVGYNMYITDKEIPNMTNIKTQDKTAFGRTLHYVTDPVQADALQTLTGKKTLTDKDIICLQLLGLQVNGVNYVNQLQLAGV